MSDIAHRVPTLKRDFLLPTGVRINMLILLTGFFALIIVFGAAALLNDATELFIGLRQSAGRPSSTTPGLRARLERFAADRRGAVGTAARLGRPPSLSHRDYARYPGDG